MRRDNEITGVVIDGKFVPNKRIISERVVINKHDCKVHRMKYGSKKLYDNSVILEVPRNLNIRYNRPDRAKKNNVVVDPCLKDEIKYLWSLGIITTGCCCGHNIGFAYIGVEEDFIPEMEKLGYKHQLNPMNVEANDIFVPKILNT